MCVFVSTLPLHGTLSWKEPVGSSLWQLRAKSNNHQATALQLCIAPAFLGQEMRKQTPLVLLSAPNNFSLVAQPRDFPPLLLTFLSEGSKSHSPMGCCDCFFFPCLFVRANREPLFNLVPMSCAHLTLIDDCRHDAFLVPKRAFGSPEGDANTQA
ncbi:hypothetical protein B0J18DRAFT_66784 [Chaetomium sp. MPI-SDFR-AT-0129]|nr:hypothetical protein B0J18DRAFT_66784 [Chaetomium sp. MPI-SDFR-AT-0129]